VVFIELVLTCLYLKYNKANFVNLFYRTEHILERFEDAPDDHANWGKAIRMDQKLYKTESDEDSSENENLILDDTEKKIRFGADVMTSTSRARTGNIFLQILN
jgi:hypothetical protein